MWLIWYNKYLYMGRLEQPNIYKQRKILSAFSNILRLTLFFTNFPH